MGSLLEDPKAVSTLMDLTRLLESLSTKGFHLGGLKGSVVGY
jgi:hypothetical protein